MPVTSLRPNLVKRIARLPKPTNVADALQPLFEAVSNAIHSTQARFPKTVAAEGRVTVTVQTDRKKEAVTAIVEDNGPGLNERNWEAFITTDTDNKIEIGGKGVGRLMWLDCFAEIRVDTSFVEGDGMKRRAFNFVLALNNQIQNEVIEAAAPREPYFLVEFKGLRSNGYRDKWPGRGNYVFQHLTSHFLPTFIGKRCPEITVHIGEETRTYPQAINEIVHRTETMELLPTEEFGDLKLTMMECEKIASADLKGSHFIHFIAHDRTVHSQSIDGKLGLKYFGPGDNMVFHAILTGAFLDKHVNQERTKFLFEDAILERMINDVCWPHVETFLAAPLAKLKGEQKAKIESITATYPSVAFGDVDELQDKVPSGELKEDAIYGHLSRERFRRDERQAEKIRIVLTRLKDDDVTAESFGTAIKEAGKAIEEAEQRSLAEYVVRRKVVLDFIAILLEKVKDEVRDFDLPARGRPPLLHLPDARQHDHGQGEEGRARGLPRPLDRRRAAGVRPIFQFGRRFRSLGRGDRERRAAGHPNLRSRSRASTDGATLKGPSSRVQTPRAHQVHRRREPSATGRTLRATPAVGCAHGREGASDHARPEHDLLLLYCR